MKAVYGVLYVIGWIILVACGVNVLAALLWPLAIPVIMIILFGFKR